ncbi:SGNH/GDSL hydrolase family protein [Paenibacillus sp.]|uniref:SGNH/GDSL hydrolase family protein n=1 Tax=Paenibacillus sp. TaxID=58172 RepID=UPI002D75538B|nr:SGNH/GDSL hydrolase family protein [Paenibacillus sp.]HZG83393.1 SGNH/GDSL hydrolase family protein [Paenibacillus sp.]
MSRELKRKNELDPLVAAPVETVDDVGVKWMSPLSPPFRIAGFPWIGKEGIYRRLPSNPGVRLPRAVDTLADCTAGGQIRFRTDSSRLLIKVRLAGTASMYHMTAAGQCGFDCYVAEPGKPLRYLSTARFHRDGMAYSDQLYKWGDKRTMDVVINFPLYQGVKEVWIGVDEAASVGEPPPYACDKPIVIYGTSVTQGGCASRPGMAYPNILSRMIPLPFVNLGFSGSGKGEPEVAKLIADIEDPALYVLDYEGNTGAPENIAGSLPVFVQLLRERHPNVPILVVSRIRNSVDLFYEDKRELSEARRRIQREYVMSRRAGGDSQIHFLDGSALLGEEYAEECTVDGKHPTDLGFMRIAQALKPAIEKLVGLKS